jgi:hypothetical protein
MIGGIAFCHVLSPWSAQGSPAECCPLLPRTYNWRIVVSLVGFNDHLPQLRGHDLNCAILSSLKKRAIPKSTRHHAGVQLVDKMANKIGITVVIRIGFA